jgi:hypothetical protein
MFDRTEIILPVVPLNVYSRCTFKIINDGYDNLNLNYRVMDDMGLLSIQCNFPDGRQLGVGKSKARVEVFF